MCVVIFLRYRDNLTCVFFSKLFFVDDEIGPSGDIGRDEEDDDEENEEEKGSDDEDYENDNEEAGPAKRPEPILSSRKKPAWTDPSDPPVVSLVASKRSRKLRDAPSETTLSAESTSPAFAANLSAYIQLQHGLRNGGAKAKMKTTMTTAYSRQRREYCHGRVDAHCRLVFSPSSDSETPTSLHKKPTSNR